VKVDVAIVGGGPAASAAAIALRRRGLTCAIVERGDGRGARVGESLAPAVKPLLAQLGLDLAADGHLPCHGHRSTWGSGVPVETCFDSNPYGHGWHLDRRKFDERLAQLADVPRFTNRRVMDVERAPSGWRLTCHSERSEESPAARDPSLPLGMTLIAGFLIDATGRRAAMARRLGARIVRGDTLLAHVFFIDRELDDTYTTIEAEENGWWYRAPVPGGKTIAMFVSSMEDRHSCLSFGTRGQARMPVLHRDASSARLDRVAGERWLAIGDAATALDPLSSHGLGNALFTGIRAAEAIVSGDFAAYENAVEKMWSVYVSRRRELYAAERRWPSSPFWSRRYTAPP
jgi:flavin-dependent dehydrogenase